MAFLDGFTLDEATTGLDNGTIPTAVAIGDLIVCEMTNFSGNTITPSMNRGPFTVIQNPLTGDGDNCCIGYGFATSAGSCTITDVGGLSLLINAVAHRSSTGGYTQDQSVVTTHALSGTNAVSAATGTTTQAVDLVIGAIGSTLVGAGFSYSNAGGYTIRKQIAVNNNVAGGIADKTTSSTGTQTAQFTQSLSAEYGIWCLTFYETGGGGGGRTLQVRSGLDGLSSSGPKQFNPSLG